MNVDYTWDEAKERANRRKHGVSFYEAIVALRDIDRVVLEIDARHDCGDVRLRTLGGVDVRVLLVVTTEAGDNGVRIISARKANRHEQKTYHENFVGPR